MRNLKKFLALALAMVMAFSMILSANALEKYDQVKDWDDKAQVTKEFTEAVDVLSGMKVFQGDERGFAPQGYITRAETAALIYRLATGDNSDVRAGLYANYGNFKDVNESDWFAGYVGYCANAGYIKGHNGYFNPYGNVTGYEALAMILRAVGYDKNHEFEGATWQTNVSALGTRLGVLDQVKTTHYANTLHLPSTREVVASILFETASEVATVTYTPSLGYETNNVGSGNTADGWNARTLGVINYGLTEFEGIIVGNQDTGESSTRINYALDDMPAHAAYFHQTTNWNENVSGAGKNATTTGTVTIDAKTGIDMFGHKVHGWKGTTKGVDDKKTYALYDDAVLTALVASVDDAANYAPGNAKLSDATNGAADADLGRAAVAAGFTVDLKSSKAVFNQDFGVSGSTAWTDGGTAYGFTDYVADGADAVVGSGHDTNGVSSASQPGYDQASGGWNAGRPLYLLISNSSDKKVDMVIAVNALVSKVTQVNNHATYPTITVLDNSHDNWNDKDRNMIEQKALTATSDKDLGTPVVGIAIIGTNTADVKTNCGIDTTNNDTVEAKGFTPTTGSEGFLDADDNNTTNNYFYRLSKPTQVVEGTVTGYNHDSNNITNKHWANSGSITIDGKTIQRSLLADSIVGYAANTDSLGRHRTGAYISRGIGYNGKSNVGLSPDTGDYGKYRVYLDSEGKYIWAEPIYSTEFVYGTYIDYTTPYGSSTYEYTLVGVNLAGEQVKRVVKTVNGRPIDNITDQANSVPMKDLGLPYRDSTNVSGVTKQSYVGYLIDSEGNLTSITAGNPATLAGSFPTISPTVKQAGLGNEADADILDDSGAGSTWSFNTTDAKLGTKLLDGSTYATGDTKFILVDGGGTDTQKIEVYNGISELLKGGSTVTITGTNALTKTSDAYLDAVPATGAGTHFNAQVYYTSSPLSYASVDGTNPTKVDTIIIPKNAVSWTGGSNLYFIGNPAQNSEITQGVNTFHLYTMYENGEEVQKWLTNTPGSNNSDRTHQLVKDSFYVLVDTGLKTPMGDTVYTAHDDGTNNGSGVIGASNTWTSNAGIVQKTDTKSRPGIIGNNCHPILNRVEYNAATYASQTAKIGAHVNGTADDDAGYAIFNVSGAKVVNLNAKRSGAALIWPNVTDLGTLNDASSTSEIYNGTNKFPMVSIQTSPTDPLTVTVIYVNWDQSTMN